MQRLGDRAIVIGGSIAGLITARVLSDYFDRVVILERDVVEDRPVLHRSVPQGHHLHALLQGGQNVVAAFYPGFTEELRALGATRVAVGRDIVWYLPDGKAYTATGSLRAPSDVGLEGHCASRDLIEFLVRRRTTAIANVEWESAVAVRELIERDGCVRGVRCDDSRAFEAELVVDATGRASRAPQWLRDHNRRWSPAGEPDRPLRGLSPDRPGGLRPLRKGAPLGSGIPDHRGSRAAHRHRSPSLPRERPARPRPRGQWTTVRGVLRSGASTWSETGKLSVAARNDGRTEPLGGRHQRPRGEHPRAPP